MVKKNTYRKKTKQNWCFRESVNDLSVTCQYQGVCVNIDPSKGAPKTTFFYTLENLPCTSMDLPLFSHTSPSWRPTSAAVHHGAKRRWWFVKGTGTGRAAAEDTSVASS